MSSPKKKDGLKSKKKPKLGHSHRTKWGNPGPHGGNKNYRKKYRGQGKR